MLSFILVMVTFILLTLLVSWGVKSTYDEAFHDDEKDDEDET